MNYGKFYKVGNRLVLRYMKIPGIHKYKSKSIFNINGFESKSDSIKLKISCFEIDSTKIDYFDYSIKNLKTDSLIFYRKPYMLNQENINLPKTPDSLKLRIAWRSNETEILLNGQNNYQIDLYLENMAKPRYNSYSGIIQMYSRRKEDGKKILVRKNSKYEFKLYEK